MVYSPERSRTRQAIDWRTVSTYSQGSARMGLEMAAIRGGLDMVNVLIKAGADVLHSKGINSQPCRRLPFRSRGERTCARFLATPGPEGAAKLWNGRGREVFQVDPPWPHTSLSLAAEKKHVETVQLLLGYGSWL
ncbi:hypothetical protein BJX63DRAFT_260142 [Aspergillus granulosus]|uniref:Uncharacterized protein n=1 Tax=Aspergillus granulosus TaxID=176169 RepID=A0ABR4HBK1_9EURO